MTPRTLMGIAAGIAGALAIAIAVNGWFGFPEAVAAMQFIAFCAVFGVGIYLLGAGVVLLTHETWISRVVERMKQ